MWYSSWKTPALCAALVGCGTASAAVPIERVTSPEASVSAAEALGAASSSQAQLHLQLAKEQLDKGKKLLAAGEAERADLMLMRADADALLAQALARENTAKLAAQQVIEQVQAQRQNGR